MADSVLNHSWPALSKLWMKRWAFKKGKEASSGPSSRQKDHHPGRNPQPLAYCPHGCFVLVWFGVLFDWFVFVLFCFLADVQVGLRNQWTSNFPKAPRTFMNIGASSFLTANVSPRLCEKFIAGEPTISPVDELPRGR